MPTNVTPEYKKAEEACRKAREPKERLAEKKAFLIAAWPGLEQAEPQAPGETEDPFRLTPFGTEHRVLERVSLSVRSRHFRSRRWLILHLSDVTRYDTSMKLTTRYKSSDALKYHVVQIYR